jgi:hypothetical protein
MRNRKKIKKKFPKFFLYLIKGISFVRRRKPNTSMKDYK